MNEKVSAYFEALRGKRIAVLGIGVSNRPLLRMLLARGLDVAAYDKTPRGRYNSCATGTDSRGHSAERPCVRKVRAPQGKDNG